MKPGRSFLRWPPALAAWRPPIAAALAVAIAAASPPALAQSGSSESSDAVKAAFLFNFAKFTTWPAKVESDGTIKFCVQENAIQSAAFSGWDKKRIQNRPVRVTYFSLARAGALNNCSVIFFQHAPQDLPVKDLMSLASSKSALVVSDMPGFGAGGGHIELFVVNRRLRFRVNIGAMSKSNLTLGAGVLNLAEIVTTTEGAK
jgi:hypothetical protein